MRKVLQNLIVARCSAESRSPARVWDGAEASQSLAYRLCGFPFEVCFLLLGFVRKCKAQDCLPRV